MYMCLVFSLEESAKGLSGQTAPFFTDKQENLGYNLGKIFLTKRRDGGIILKKKRLTALLLSVILSVIPAISCLAEGTEPVSEANDLTDQVVIYHTNDMHGALEEGSGKFSIAQTAALKENTEHAFLVDAGDATQGVPLASITKGKDVIRLMNMAGYDAMCLGNHEFDYDMQILQENIGLAEFPILGANALYNGAPVGQTDQQNGAYTILETGGRKIGVFGLITKDTSTKANPEVVGQIDFTDEVETAKEQIDILEEQDVDAIIALGHLGNEGGTSCTSEDLAQAMTGEYQGKLDAIIDGHSHTIENNEVNDVQIVQTGYNMRGVGKLTLQFTDGEEDEVTVTEELLQPDESYASDAEIQALLSQILEEQEQELAQTICETGTALWGGWIENAAISRRAQCNLGELAAEAFRVQAERAVSMLSEEERAEYQEDILAVVNGGGVRDQIPNGYVTKKHVLTVFPFSNTMMVKAVTPQQLFEILELSVRSHSAQDTATGMVSCNDDGGFLQTAGFCFTYDPAKPEGEKIIRLWIPGNEEDIELSRDDTEKKYLLATNSFIASGGNNYEIFASLPIVAEGIGEAEALEAYLTENATGGLLEPGQASIHYGAIPRTEGYKAEPYTARIRIKSPEGNPLAGTKISYYVDGEGAFEGETDGEGFLAIEGLEPGGHGIRLDKNQREVYVNNYIGIGITEVENVFSYPELVWTGKEPEEPEKPVDPQKPDPQKPSGGNTSGNTPVKTATVKTGDSNRTMVWMVLLFASMGIGGSTLYRKRKRG